MIIVIVPLFWIIMTSLKTNMEFTMNPWGFPDKFQFVNYYNVWVKVNFGAYTFNSVFITLLSTILAVLISSVTAYILVRFKFKGKKLIKTLIISGLFVPITLILLPEYLTLNYFGLINTRSGLILVYIIFSIPFSTLVMTGFYEDMPKDIEESAYIDGSSYNRTFWEIIFPISRNGLLTIGVLNFIWIWNDYILALTYIYEESKRTLQVGLIGLMESFKLKADWVTLFAGLSLVMIPSIFIFIIFQSKMVESITSGSIKM